MFGKRDRDRWKQAEELSEQWRQNLNLRDEDISRIKQEVYAKHQIKKPSLLPWLAIGLPVAATSILLLVVIILQESEKSPSEKTLISQYQPPSGEYTYASSASWQPVVCSNEGIENYIQTVQQKNFIDFNLINQSPGGSVGAVRVLTEQPELYAFAVSSDKLRPAQESEASARGFELKEIPIARDAIAFIAHPDLDINGLTKEQIRQIYIGENGQRITWSSLGFNAVEANLEATPLSRMPSDSGTARYFFDWIGTSNPDFDSVVEIVPYAGTSGELDGGIVRTSNEPGSIFYATATEIFGLENVEPIPVFYGDQTRLPYTSSSFSPLAVCANPAEQSGVAPVNLDYHPELVRPIYAIVKDYPENASSNQQNHERVGAAYACMLLTDEGQELLQKIGYFPIEPKSRASAIEDADCDQFRPET